MENPFEVILESTIVGIYLVQDGVFRYVNPALARILGYQPEELIDKLDPLDLIHPDDRPMVRENIQKRIEGRVSHVHSVFRGLRKDGTTIWCEVYGSRTEYEGKPAIVGTLLDITERKQAEEALRESEERYRDLVEKSRVAILVLDAEGRIVFFNRKVCELSGCESVELEGGFFANWVHPEDLERVLDYHHRRMAGDPTVPEWYEFRGIRKDGSLRYIMVSVTPIKTEGRVVGSRVYLYDITEQKKLEEELEESKQAFQRVLESLNEAVVMIDTDFVIQVSNRAASDIMGIPEERFVGRRCYELFHDRDAVCPGCPAKKAMETKWKVSDIWYRPDGLILEMVTYPVLDREGRVIGATILGLDITEQKRTEEALRESEERYRTLVENSLTGIFIHQDGKFVFVNERFAQMHGYSPEELIGKNYLELIYPEDREAAKERTELRLKGKKLPEAHEIRRLTKDGRVIWCQMMATLTNYQGKPAVMGDVIDVTWRKQAEQNLRRAITRLRLVLEHTIHAFASTVEKRDPYTAGHQKRVAQLARAIAEEMGLPREECVGIYMAGLVHDIGKISVPAEILSKPTRLTDVEFEILKAHPKVGYEILKEVDFPWPVAEMVSQHHERMNGSGYPRGLKDGDIVIGARILAVADVVEAMSSHRPYRPALGIEAALEEIQRGKGTLYDPQVVDTCIRLFREKGFQFEGCEACFP